jgi:hypothetical protein
MTRAPCATRQYARGGLSFRRAVSSETCFEGERGLWWAGPGVGEDRKIGGWGKDRKRVGEGPKDRRVGENRGGMVRRTRARRCGPYLSRYCSQEILDHIAIPPLDGLQAAYLDRAGEFKDQWPETGALCESLLHLLLHDARSDYILLILIR